MTGPEHYREAERLVEQSTLDTYDKDRSRYARADLLAEAQVHATLALVAAAAYPPIRAYTGDETGDEARGWAEATA